MSARKKSLLIGINYTGSNHQLNGCRQDVENVAEFLSYRGYSSDPRSQVILRDDYGGMYYPSGHNMLVSILNRHTDFRYPLMASILICITGRNRLAGQRTRDLQLLPLFRTRRTSSRSNGCTTFRNSRHYLPRGL